MSHRARSRSLPVVLCLALSIAAGGGIGAYTVAMDRLSDRLDRSLTLTRRAVEAEIDRFRYLPEVAKQDVRIQEAIARPTDAAVIGAANRYLEAVAAAASADHLYLLDQDGVAIAASNWTTPDSFVGMDYSFRPYFAEAMRDGAGRFYGIGVTTGEPGYFLSSRVATGAAARAVMVVKIDLTPLQDAWREAGVDTAVADGDGIVFLAGPPDWLYQPLTALDPAASARIAATRRYEGVDLGAATPLVSGDPEGPVTIAGRTRLLRRIGTGPDGWQIIQSAPVAGVWRTALATAAILGLSTVVIALGLQTFLQRRRLVALRLRQGRMLEDQVARRTQELAAEIEIRIAAETELTRAQDALVHAVKMAALGRMSAAIVHEISQPLAAMEATLAAASIGVTRADQPTLKRIDTARGHIRRMQRTIKHLKSFSRKDTGPRAPVDMDTVIDNAVDLVRHRAQDADVAILWRADGTAPAVMGGLVRLEQVIVNLLLNAIDAVTGRPDRTVTLDRRVTADDVVITVTDTGVGLDPAALAKIGEPFHSRKQSGDGLGLGVSISQTIVEDFDGTLGYASVLDEGTVATVTLPRADRAAGASAA